MSSSTKEMSFEVVNNRVARLRAKMTEQGMDAFVLLVLERYNSESCHYISGFRGSSAAIVIDHKRAVIVTDGRYRTQVVQQTPFEIVMQTQGVSLALWVAQAVRDAGYKTVGFEADKISQRMFSLAFAPVKTNWVDAGDLIPGLRRTKDAEEVELIKKAGVIGYQALQNVLKTVRVGMTEIEFDSALMAEIKKLGAEKGWAHDDFIVAAGERGAMCHARPTDRAFQRGDIVTVDYGAMVGGYMSDITRDFSVGEPSAKALEVNDVVLKAHRAAAAALRPGIAGRDVDAVARKVISDAGYGKDFIHGLGHSFGLEIHESPRLSEVTKDILQVGDVVTIEPGIYIEGWGGIRIEDDYLITENGAEVLTVTDNQSLTILDI